MPKRSVNLAIPFVQKGTFGMFFCPVCGRALKAVIPAVSVTYLVHFFGNLCVVDNQPVVQDDVSKS